MGPRFRGDDKVGVLTTQIPAAKTPAVRPFEGMMKEIVTIHG
jgi:hypothetical protein